MTDKSKTVTIIGAGVMGGGIAGLFANAGYKVHLLNIDEKDRKTGQIIPGRTFVENRVQEMQKASLNPPADPFNAVFHDPANARNIVPGNSNSDEDLKAAVQDSGLVIEVIPEVLKWKQALFARIESFMEPGTIVTSNTSSLSAHSMTEGRSEEFNRNFAITHFYNPPRFLPLLELVRTEHTDPAAMDKLWELMEVDLGRTVIETNDEPAMAGNRLGIYYMFRAIEEATKRGLPIEDVDALLGKPLQVGDGVFKVLDQVGIDLTPHLATSLSGSLDQDDDFFKIDRGPSMAIVDRLIAEGRTGRKSDTKAGFYRVEKLENGKKKFWAVDLKTGEDRPTVRHQTPAMEAGKEGPRAVFEAKKDPLADYAWVVMRDTLLYAAKMVPSVTDNIADIDKAMKAGYGWKSGPFELLDKIGLNWFLERTRADGFEIPPVLEIAARSNRSFYSVINGKNHHLTFDFETESAEYQEVRKPEGAISLTEIKRTTKPLVTHNSASLWDIGDGVVCLEFHSKGNTIDPSTLYVLNESLKLVNNSGGQYKAMVIHNNGKDFSLGANLGLPASFIKVADAKPASSLNNFAVNLLRKIHVPDSALEPLNKATSAVARILDKPYEWTVGAATNRLSNIFFQNMVFQGQAVYKAMREAPFPVIGAPRGQAFGGGCEILLHCDAIQAGAETYMGLVEAGVGLIPGWGGCVRYLERAFEAATKNGGMVGVAQAAMTLADPLNSVSRSAQNAKTKLWLRPDDGFSMNPDLILADAKARALAMVDGYTPPEPAVFRLPGADGKNALRMYADQLYMKGGDPAKGGVNHVDLGVIESLADTLTGGERLYADEVDLHVAKHQDHIKGVIAAKEKGYFGVNESVILTENRVLQLERDNIFTQANKPEPRIRMMRIAFQNAFTREPYPEPRPTPNEIRDGIEPARLPRRNPTGLPLEGEDAKTLERMAEATKVFYRVGKVFGLV